MWNFNTCIIFEKHSHLPLNNLFPQYIVQYDPHTTKCSWNPALMCQQLCINTLRPSLNLKRQTFSTHKTTYSKAFLTKSSHIISHSLFVLQMTVLCRFMHVLTLIPAWISNGMSSNVWDEITCPFPTFNGATVEVWEWLSKLIPHFIMDVMNYPCWD